MRKLNNATFQLIRSKELKNKRWSQLNENIKNYSNRRWNTVERRPKPVTIITSSE